MTRETKVDVFLAMMVVAITVGITVVVIESVGNIVDAIKEHEVKLTLVGVEALMHPATSVYTEWRECEGCRGRGMRWEKRPGCKLEWREQWVLCDMCRGMGMAAQERKQEAGK